MRETDGGRAGLLVGGAPETVTRQSWPALPSGVSWAIDLVAAPDTLKPALTKALDRVAVVEDLEVAADLVRTLVGIRAVTRGGDLLGSDWAFGGSAGKQSVIELQAAADSAEASLAEVTAKIGNVEASLSGARAQAQLRDRDARAALMALNQSDAQMSAVGEQLGRLAEAARSAAAEAARLDAQRQSAEESRRTQEETLVSLESRLAAAESADAPTAVDTSERDMLQDAVTEARHSEIEWRLSLRTTEERARASAGAADGLRRAARAERESRARAEAARTRRAAGAAVATKVADLAVQASEKLAESLAVAAQDRASATQARSEAEMLANSTRKQVTELSAAWEKLTSAVHRDEVLRAQQNIRIEQLEDKLSAEFGISVTDLIAEFGPRMPVPPSAAEMAEYQVAKDRGDQVVSPQPMAFDREAQQRNVKRGAGSQPIGQGEPAGVGGICGIGRAARLPVHPVGGSEGHPPRSDDSCR